MDRERAQERLLAPADDPDLDTVSPAERAEQALAVRGVADGGGGDGDHPRIAVPPRAREEAVDGGHRPRDRVIRQRAPAAAPEPCLHPFLLEHLEAQAGTEARQQQTDRVGAELDEGDDIAGHGLGCYPAGPAGTTALGTSGSRGVGHAPDARDSPPTAWLPSA